MACKSLKTAWKGGSGHRPFFVPPSKCQVVPPAIILLLTNTIIAMQRLLPVPLPRSQVDP